MLKWETGTQPESTRQSVIKTRNARLSVTDRHGQQWQMFSLDFGEFSDESHDACCLTWSAEAIAKARALLDELKAKVEEPCTEQ